MAPQVDGPTSTSEHKVYTSEYLALPFAPMPQRAEIMSAIMRKVASHETLFTDYERLCEDECMSCARCQTRLVSIARMLTNPYARVWEVWSHAGELAGILYLTDIIPGNDAKAHYVFFNGVSDKTSIIEALIQWVFHEHEGWRPLRRLTVEVPDFAFIIARHAQRKLGFGGPFKHRVGGRAVRVEGVRERALLWRNVERDILILGRHNGSIQ